MLGVVQRLPQSEEVSVRCLRQKAKQCVGGWHISSLSQGFNFFLNYIPRMSCAILRRLAIHHLM